MKAAFKIYFLTLLFLTACSDSKYPTLNSLYIDYLAEKDLKNEKYEEALSKYYSILENDGGRAGIHSNIGVILNNIQKAEDSLKSLQHALKLAEASNDDHLIFKIQYNLGVYYGALKKIPEALEHYQSALDREPTSIETKTNIELLLQQQQQDQKQKNGEGEKNQEQPPKKDEGDKDDQNKKSGTDPKNQDPKDGQDKKDDQKKQSSPKYQPRPFKGEQLSEGDVKKILGELKNQEQKIRANFEKKEKGKSKNNEKNW